ncbi:putative calcium uptake protein 1, mitochondrial-like [Apostichopus japonicus]|uniref:Putative calcium uptake protein 1, mitochondrial-like n=1 Tax=Stichopus japonicus TaxID=307972 RepID=A0A2G8JLH8_STIJA|nr:putative calcium uptake protein 1, mitochondrial-like [Apostichopus japonicus]
MGTCEGITFDEMEALQKFLSNVNDINTALSFYHVAGADIDPDTFKHVAKMVGGSDLSQRVVDVIYSLFDENDDGKLSHKELISVMKHRQQRVWTSPKNWGSLESWRPCGNVQRKPRVDISISCTVRETASTLLYSEIGTRISLRKLPLICSVSLRGRGVGEILTFSIFVRCKLSLGINPIPESLRCFESLRAGGWRCLSLIGEIVLPPHWSCLP